MTNEILFFVHIVVIVLSTGWSIKLGSQALVALFSLQTLLANLFVTKQMEFFGLTVTCTDVYTIGAILSLNLLQEIFGKKVAREAIWTMFFLSLFFLGMSHIHLLYTPSSRDTMQISLQTLFQHTPRIVLASISISFLAARLELFLYAFVKKRYPYLPFSIRFFSVALFSQFFDTISFTFAGLYGILSPLLPIFFLSYLVKIATISLMSLFSIALHKWTSFSFQNREMPS